MEVKESGFWNNIYIYIYLSITIHASNSVFKALQKVIVVTFSGSIIAFLRVKV